MFWILKFNSFMELVLNSYAPKDVCQYFNNIQPEVPHRLLSNCSTRLFLLCGRREAWELGHMVQSWATMHRDEGASGGLDA